MLFTTFYSILLFLTSKDLPFAFYLRKFGATFVDFGHIDLTVLYEFFDLIIWAEVV